MHRRLLLIPALAAAAFALAAASPYMRTILPSGWRLTPPAGPIATVGTMPQGIALSPDGKTLAVVESGVNPAALRLLDAKTLATIKSIELKGRIRQTGLVQQNAGLRSGRGDRRDSSRRRDNVRDSIVVALDKGLVAGWILPLVRTWENPPLFQSSLRTTITIEQGAATFGNWRG